MDEEEEVEAEVEEGDKVRSALFPNREWFPSPNCFSFSVVPTKFQLVHQGTIQLRSHSSSNLDLVKVIKRYTVKHLFALYQTDTMATTVVILESRLEIGRVQSLAGSLVLLHCLCILSIMQPIYVLHSGAPYLPTTAS